MDKKNNNLLGWIFSSPYLVFSLVFFLIPLVWAIFLAFTDWNLIAPSYHFVGFKNFVDALSSPAVRAAFVVSYKFLIVFVPIVVAMSLLVSYLIYLLPKHNNLYLVGFFLPYLSSGVVTSLIVKGFLSYNGPVMTFLRETFGVQTDVLGTPMGALSVVAIMIAWKMTGYYSLILYAGIEGISKEVYEAAEIDGCKGLRKFFSITLPLLYPALYTVLVMAIGISFGIFTEVYQLTGGGPDYATNTWQMEIYRQAFMNLKTGYASAISLISAVVTFVSLLVIRKFIEMWGKHYGWS